MTHKLTEDQLDDIFNKITESDTIHGILQDTIDEYLEENNITLDDTIVIYGITITEAPI